VAIDNGFVACVPKPCDGKELLSAIAQVTAIPDKLNELITALKT
jgi:hypothetical protein